MWINHTTVIKMKLSNNRLLAHLWTITRDKQLKT